MCMCVSYHCGIWCYHIVWLSAIQLEYSFSFLHINFGHCFVCDSAEEASGSFEYFIFSYAVSDSIWRTSSVSNETTTARMTEQTNQNHRRYTTCECGGECSVQSLSLGSPRPLKLRPKLFVGVSHGLTTLHYWTICVWCFEHIYTPEERYTDIGKKPTLYREEKTTHIRDICVCVCAVYSSFNFGSYLTTHSGNAKDKAIRIDIFYVYIPRRSGSCAFSLYSTVGFCFVLVRFPSEAENHSI